MTTIKIITGSTRPGRFNTQPAQWMLAQAQEIAKKHTDVVFELVDIATFNLPLLDEATPAMFKKYEKDHTKKWSAAIESADGFIFIVPEYNHSVPGALKNAIDFIQQEWSYKPASFVSYGSAAGGSRAVEHMRAICGELRMFDLREQLLMSNYWGNLDANGAYTFTKEQSELAGKIIEDTIVWAQAMKAPRQAIAATRQA
jgi:NAD(P)H-dependent FMN reductase